MDQLEAEMTKDAEPSNKRNISEENYIEFAQKKKLFKRTSTRLEEPDQLSSSGSESDSETKLKERFFNLTMRDTKVNKHKKGVTMIPETPDNKIIKNPTLSQNFIPVSKNKFEPLANHQNNSENRQTKKSPHPTSQNNHPDIPAESRMQDNNETRNGEKNNTRNENE